MEKQCTTNLLMIRPINFGFNEAAAESNAFMENLEFNENPQVLALKYFDEFVEKLRANGIRVWVVNDQAQPKTPDSIFPNNWISLHADGRIVLYPMEVENRRLERRNDILDLLKKQFKVTAITDLSAFENKGLFLEGTGSLVLDRTHKVAYVCQSSRSSKDVLSSWHIEFPDYEIVVFDATDRNNFPIYHTNVLMTVAEDFVIICLDSIRNIKQKQNILASFQKTKKEVIEISLEQMEAFAGNMLQVENQEGEKILVMSSQAYRSLNPRQLNLIETKTKILHTELGPIETLGGGSARCMLTEIHLPLH